MSLVYRAIWQDSRTDLCESSLATFRSWARQKHGSDLRFWDHVEEAPAQAKQVAAARLAASEDGGLKGAEAVLIEEQPSQRWMTRLRVLVSADGEQWLWVDLERVAHDAFKRQDVAAPRLVRDLIADGNTGGGNPRIVITPLRTKVEAVRDIEVVQTLVPLLTSPERRAPVVLFSHDEQLSPTETMRRAQTTADIVAGVAPVFVLPPSAETVLQQELGRALSVWGGAARLYLPGSLDPSRHRYIRREIVERNIREAGKRIAFMLASPIAAQRAPNLYERIRPLLRFRSGQTDQELLDLIDVELKEKNDEIDVLRALAEARDDQLLDLLGELEQANEELDKERSRYRNVLWKMNNPGGTGDTSEFVIPSSAKTLTEAAALCREHLTGVVLHPDACHDLDELDSAPEATAWAATAWRALRALHAYANEAKDVSGGFWQWCVHSDHPDTWPATPKKLSMTESDTVVNSARLRAARMLPVASTVDAGGSIEMLAHLKVAEGGGSNIPRIYFHDDTAKSGKIHVGFFGPHRYMENSKT
jgi:hypothetical protein